MHPLNCTHCIYGGRAVRMAFIISGTSETVDDSGRIRFENQYRSGVCLEFAISSVLVADIDRGSECDEEVKRKSWPPVGAFCLF